MASSSAILLCPCTSPSPARAWEPDPEARPKSLWPPDREGRPEGKAEEAGLKKSVTLELPIAAAGLIRYEGDFRLAPSAAAFHFRFLRTLGVGGRTTGRRRGPGRRADAGGEMAWGRGEDGGASSVSATGEEAVRSMTFRSVMSV